LRITSRFTLDRHSKRLDIRTRFYNGARYHRLRVAFPTGIHTEFTDAEGHFTVDRRSKPNQPAEDGSYWPEMQTLPTQRFVDVSDGAEGIALLHDCLTEYELADDENATLYLTLLRATGNMIVTWWEAVGQFEDQDGSQTQRDQEFNYAIYPHDGDWQTAQVYREAEKMNARAATYQIRGNSAGDMPLSASFLEITNPNVVVSAFKQSENGKSLILRIFNPTDKEQIAGVKTGFDLESIWECDLAETPLNQLKPTAPQARNSFSITCPKGKIQTLSLHPHPQKTTI